MTPKDKKDWTPEPFPKPRTFPNGWEGSALTTTNGKRGSRDMHDSQPKSHEDDDWKPEKFPKPRTYPKNWRIDD